MEKLVIHTKIEDITMTWKIVKKNKASKGTAIHTIEVNDEDGSIRCTCQSFKIRKDICKHIVQYTKETM